MIANLPDLVVLKIASFLQLPDLLNLLKYDYKKVFSEFDTTRNTWPNNKLWIIELANILKIILGQKFKLNFYKKMSYYSSYNYVYRLFGKDFYQNNYKSSRSPESFISKKFLEESKFI